MPSCVQKQSHNETAALRFAYKHGILLKTPEQMKLHRRAIDWGDSVHEYQTDGGDSTPSGLFDSKGEVGKPPQQILVDVQAGSKGP